MNKIVLITGAISGYGLATARKFSKNGDTAIIASRNDCMGNLARCSASVIR